MPLVMSACPVEGFPWDAGGGRLDLEQSLLDACHRWAIGGSACALQRSLRLILDPGNANTPTAADSRIRAISRASSLTCFVQVQALTLKSTNSHFESEDKGSARTGRLSP